MKTIFNSHILFLWKVLPKSATPGSPGPSGSVGCSATQHGTTQFARTGRLEDLEIWVCWIFWREKNPSTSSSFDGSLSFSESCHCRCISEMKNACKRITILQLKALVYPHISGRQVSWLTDFQLPIGFEGRTNMASCEIHTETYMDNPKGSCRCIYIYFIFYILN